MTKGLGGEQVEGRQAVRELLAAGRRRVQEVWLADGMDDALILTDVYPAGEAPIAGVSGRLVVHAVVDASPTLPVTYLPRAADLVDVPHRFARPGDLVLTLGAGDVGLLGPALLARLDADPADGRPTC